MTDKHAQIVALLLLLGVALFLAACTPGTAQQPTPQPPTPTITLTTATEPDAPDPTPPPAPNPTTPPPVLVGPEWTVAYEGDLNRDGVRDVVAYKAADITPASAMNSYLAEMPLTIAEAIIVQEAAPGSSDPLVQASASPQGVAAADTPLLSVEQFGEPGPVAFLMGVNPQAQDVQVSFIPLNDAGGVYAQGFGLYWNEGQRAYRLFVGGQAVPPPNVPDGSTLPRHTPLPSETQAPGEIEIALYWAVGEELQPEYRRIPATQAVGTTALELLLAGPPQPGLLTALPTPEEVQSYPGRQPDWGDRVRLLGLTIEEGVATANFSQEMQAYGGGSARVQMIREQINQTLMQFPTVQEVRIAVEGEVETALQP
jgi:hypothetical protein